MASHPYYPPTATIPNYTPNTYSVPLLLSAFTLATLLLLPATSLLTSHLNPSLSRTEHLTTLWFVLSGSIHLLFEGYYVLHWNTIGAETTIIAQIWKEYAYSDSRYLTRNGMVWCMEALTVGCWGPMCLVVAWMIVRRHAMRFPLQMIVSVGQCYGDVLYYATSILDDWVMGVSYSRPEAVYFWVYFVVMNSFWIVIPGALIVQGVRQSTRAVAIVQGMEMASKKTR